MKKLLLPDEFIYSKRFTLKRDQIYEWLEHDIIKR